MKLPEVEAALDARMPVQYLAIDAGWIPDGWHDATVSAFDSSEKHPRVWLRIENSGGETLEGKKDIRERLKVKE